MPNFSLVVNEAKIKSQTNLIKEIAITPYHHQRQLSEVW